MDPLNRAELAAHVILRSPMLGLIAALVIGGTLAGIAQWLRERAR